MSELLSPYHFLTDAPDSAARALIWGGAEFVADALLSAPGSAYWRNPRPLEDGPDGAVVRWLRESNSSAADADENFNAYAAAPGCENLKRAAATVRWLFERGHTCQQAIAFTSASGDYEIWDGFPQHIRERMLRSLPPWQRQLARESWHNNFSD